MYKHYSLRRKNKESIKERSRKGVEAKERNRLESAPPVFPADPPEVWAEITVKRSINGRVQEEKTFLDGIGNSSFIVWNPDTKECHGSMGLSRALIEIGKRFPVISRGGVKS